MTTTVREMLFSKEKKSRAIEQVRATITDIELAQLEKVEIKEQHMANYIVDVLTDYPSLLHQLAEAGATQVIITSIHGFSKPVLEVKNGVAVIYVNK